MGYAIIRERAIKKTNLNDKESVVSSIVKILRSIDKKFPPKTKRFIEVDL